jgi:peptidoglycan hydrolase CwlO-like protein
LRSKVEELEAELDDVPKNVRAANTKIKKLEKDWLIC